MSSSVYRILSDIHYGDPGTALDRLAGLSPLLDGVNRLIVNGDMLDTQVISHAPAVVAEIKDFFAPRVPEFTFVTGNHDPDISDVHEIELLGGAIWITHGDVFFDDVAPWGRLLRELRRRISAIVQAQRLSPEEMRKIETRFRVFRQACLKLPREHDPSKRGTLARAERIARAVFPPTRVLKMLETWRALPGIVDRFAREQRPRAQVVITGHTHHPGVWRQPSGRHILNTGCFCPPRRGVVVDLVGDRIVVRAWKKVRGEFRLAEKLQEFSVNPSKSSAVGGRV